MIEISYIDYRRYSCSGCKTFNTEEEGKMWLLDIFIKILTDTNQMFTTPEVLKDTFKDCSLKELIEKMRDNDNKIEMIIK